MSAARIGLLTVQQPDGCDCPRAELTGVTLPTDLLALMQATAADRGVSIEQLVEEAFRNTGGRICPCLRGE